MTAYFKNFILMHRQDFADAIGAYISTNRRKPTFQTFMEGTTVTAMSITLHDYVWVVNEHLDSGLLLTFEAMLEKEFDKLCAQQMDFFEKVMATREALR